VVHGISGTLWAISLGPPTRPPEPQTPANKRQTEAAQCGSSTADWLYPICEVTGFFTPSRGGPISANNYPIENRELWLKGPDLACLSKPSFRRRWGLQYMRISGLSGANPAFTLQRDINLLLAIFFHRRLFRALTTVVAYPNYRTKRTFTIRRCCSPPAMQRSLSATGR
jgi:hypothetical protein